VFLGPLLAGLTQRPLVSVIVYAGLMFWWLLKVRPVAAPSPTRIAGLIVLLSVLAALIHAVGALAAAVFGLVWELPFWFPAAVSLLGVILARPPAVAEMDAFLDEAAATLEGMAAEAARANAAFDVTLGDEGEAIFRDAMAAVREAGGDPARLDAALAPLEALPAGQVLARLEGGSAFAEAGFALRPGVAVWLVGSGAAGRALSRALRLAHAAEDPALADYAAAKALALAEALPEARIDLPEPAALRQEAQRFADTPAGAALAALADRLEGAAP
jgi:hypothetical protein